MNAKELAKMLFHFWNETEGVEIPSTLFNDAADMLRQQQAEIEALKSVVYFLKENRPEVWEDIKGWRNP